ncbi:ferric reductase like transmembrane component-domain-containing protein [Phascolomyces articulosus]|uniref:Ferric reductase like transmembrane component-domain-containing protein n=1 Tax=Phascolomyces articulosus TaxID=60185 RepID=A0AAD5PII7_9FUNG|nr:ferric reductase like transmembrane component-domain-containing protein [Phascolomyces articulosus]
MKDKNSDSIPRNWFLNTSDFNKAGYSYALFCWSLFFGYCLIYQINRIIIYQTRKRRIQSGGKDDYNDNNKKSISNNNNRFTLFKFYNSYVRIPWLTNLIPVKHVLGVTVFFIINILFCFCAPFVLASYVPHYEVPPLGMMDRRMAYVGMVNWSFTIVLGLRNNVVTRMSGLTFEALIPFHRWVARIGFVEYLPHILFRLWWAYTRNYSWYESITLTSEYFTGAVATLGFLIIFITAFEYVRRNHFEVFYYAHIFGFLIAMVGIATHEMSCIYYMGPAFVLWVADRICRSYQSWCVPSNLQCIEPVSNNIMRVRFKYDGLKSFAPGQYVFMAFSHKNRKKDEDYENSQHQEDNNNGDNKLNNDYTAIKRRDSNNNNSKWWYLNWYPMTVAQISKKSQWDNRSNNRLLPRVSDTSDDSDKDDDTSATVYIKALGNFTKNLYNASALGHIDHFKVDGPYGPKLDTYQDHHIMACFAMGVGVTPALALIQDCMNRRSAATSTVLTSCIYLFLIIRYADEFEPFQEILESWSHATSSSNTTQNGLPLRFDLSVFVTRDTNVPEERTSRMTGTRWSCGSRPDISRCMDRIEKAEEGKKVWVHTCGSDQFMRSVLNESIRRDWEAHHETFDF